MKVVVANREFALVLSPLPANRLPKKAPLLPVVLNGSPFSASVTTNKGWAKAKEMVLEYIWIEVGAKAYYLTLNYEEKADSLKGLEFVTAEGSGPAPAKRVTATPALEAERIAKFKETWSKR